jgi:hypothetical protein
MPSKHTVSVKVDGTIRFVYDDELLALAYAGPSHTRRVSFVEPNDDGRWMADLSPSADQSSARSRYARRLSTPNATGSNSTPCSSQKGTVPCQTNRRPTRLPR